MYLVRSLRTFIGTSTERTLTPLESFLPGDEFIETDTDTIYIHNGMAWLLNPGGSPGGSDGQVQFNNNGVFGGFGIWNDSTNTLTLTKSTSAATEYFLVLDQDGSGGAHINMIAGSASGKVGMTPTYLNISTSSGVVIAGSTVSIAGSTAIIFNDAEADVDIRWGGNGVTNGYFYDAGNNRHGFGTGLPDFPVHVLSAESNVVRLERSVSGNVNFQDFYNPDTTDGNLAIWRFLSDTSGTGATEEVTFGNIFCEFDTHNHATRTGKIFFRTLDNGSFDTPMSISGNGIHGIGIGIGLSAPATSAKLEIGGTNGALLLPRMTTTQQNALTAVNGMIIFNSSTGKFTGYAGGAWVALH